MPLDGHSLNYPNLPSTQWSNVSSVFEENLLSVAAQEKLKELKSLPENWDSYGSSPINQDAIELTASLLADLAKISIPSPMIIPVHGGGIQLEWQKANGELEIEILPNKTIEYLVVDEKGNMSEGQLPQNAHIAEIACLTNWFMTDKPNINNLSHIYVASHR